MSGSPAELRAVAAEFRELASRRGIPEVVQTPADAWPGSTSANVVYDLGIAFSLALGDLAEALEVHADQFGAEP